MQEADEEMREIRKSIHDDDASGIATAILVYAKTDETSLMEDVVKRPWNSKLGTGEEVLKSFQHDEFPSWLKRQ